MKIVRRKLTVDGLRERLAAAMASQTTSLPCQHCGGKGRIERPWSAKDVGEAVGIHYGTLGRFLKSGKGLDLAAGLKVFAWLEAQERTPLDELDEEHEPQLSDKREREMERQRQVRLTAADAAARAGIDAMNRPLQARSGSRS